jgi:glucose/arabinose dehydrogenase
MPVVVALCAAGCGDSARLPLLAGIGATPTLPAPNPTLIPTIDIAPAIGWPAGVTPVAAEGNARRGFRERARSPALALCPAERRRSRRGDRGPERPANDAGLRGFVTGAVMTRAGAGGRSADRITLLRDADGDGTAESRSAFIDGLTSPFGMALVGNELYVANTDAVLRFPTATARAASLSPESSSPTCRRVRATITGRRTCSRARTVRALRHRRLEQQRRRARHRRGGRTRCRCGPSIVRRDRTESLRRGCAIRTVIAWEPHSGALWTTVNERDELGSDLVPDYMTALVDGAFYGWPYSYYGQHVDERVQPQRPELVAQAIAPDYALGAHTASLGLAFSEPARCRALSPRARSSASMAPGIAGRSPATR